jgi:hypothetical protein
MLIAYAVKEGSNLFGQNYAAAEDCYRVAAQKNPKNPVHFFLARNMPTVYCSFL